MGVSAKVKINGQTFKKELRLSGLSIVEQVLTGQLTSEDLKRPTTYEQGGSFGNDIVIRLAGFNLAKNVKRARIQEELAVAKYFQILVSNTPIDEEYTYKALGGIDGDGVVVSKEQRNRIAEMSKEIKRWESKLEYYKTQRGDYDEDVDDSYKKYNKEMLRKTAYSWDDEDWSEGYRANRPKLDYNTEIPKAEKEIARLRSERNSIWLNPEGESVLTKTHKPDNDYVRGDWVLVYRGVRYQAFKTDRDNGADVYFTEDLFEKIDDFNSVTKIAEVLHNNIGNGIIGGGMRTINDNPKYKVLEYGGYITDSEAKEGTRYHKPHGVTNKHSYQAPKGYHRLVAAMWNDIAKDAKTGRYQKYITEWTKKDMGSFDVSNVDTKEMKKLLKKRTVSANEVNLKQLTKGAVK